MGRDFSFKVNDSEKIQISWARNHVEWMCEKKFTYAELVQYVHECLDGNDIHAVNAMTQVLLSMNNDDVVWIWSC